MRAATRYLSHLAQSLPQRCLHPGALRSARVISQCHRRLCMSPSRAFDLDNLPSKRRKLSRTLSTQTNAVPEMAPILVQEVSNDAGQHHTIDLTPVESDLRRLLLDVARFAEENGESAAPASQVKLPDELAREPVVLRFTGGWVRDKLLGVPSHDIDVAINKMTGEQFGLRLKEYLEIPGNPEKYGLVGVAATEQQNQQAMASDKSKMVGGLHKIEANPEKSKHLETITTTLLGLDIDLVNLRKETYTDDSRNPQIEFGTPHEDALRRDATVNAMFYNINTQEIEDLTGRGHADMQARIIRTPLEPYQTFKDDPLRVLRLIRFASRLGYIIEPSALEAMRNVEIKAALQRKISRERVGVELEKALRGPDPHEALRLVFDLGLYYTTFSDPTIPDTVSYMPELEGWATYLDALEALVNNDGALTNVLIRDEEDTYLAWQLAALVPYRNAPQPAPAAPGRRMPPPMASSIAREGIKATNKVCDVVTASVRHAEEISQLVDQVSPRQQHVTRDGVNEEASATRDVLGMALRRWGPTWRSQVLYSYLVELADAAPSGPENITGLRERRYHTTLKLGLTIAAGIERRYTAFVQRLQSLDILEVCSLKPLLDGKALAKALGTAPGPWMKDALDVVMAWQLRNPHLTGTQQAIDAVRQQRGELPAALARHFLELTIRPLFLKNKPSNVTSAGRKKVTPDLPTKITAHALDEDALRPWKSEKERSALDLLRWTTTSLHVTMTEQLWPLLVPPILTLIDDRELKYKRMGAERLDEVLNATSPLLLQRTGLGEVFEGALLPCLAFLPPLTSEQETIELLDATYPALLTLVRVRYPLDSPLSSSPIRERIKSLDGLIRKGILHMYDSCTNRPNVLSLCFRHLCPLVRALGIETVKHLRFLIPMIGQTLSNATLIGHVGQHIMLIHAAQALQAVILNAWPRVPEYRGEVMKGLTLCWIGLEGSEAASLRQELRTSFAMLLAALGSSAEESAVFKRECAQLTAVDGRLDGLLSAQ